jgi:hypothetical protein
MPLRMPLDPIRGVFQGRFAGEMKKITKKLLRFAFYSL